MTTTLIPVPSTTTEPRNTTNAADSHATCGWCRTDFPTLKAMLAHVDRGHDAPAVLRRGFVKAA